MPKTMYFERTDGDVALSYDIVRAHYFLTGTKIDLDDHDAIRRAASQMLGISRVFHPISAEILVERGYVISAIRVYRELHDTTLAEAKAAVDKIVEKLKQKANLTLNI